MTRISGGSEFHFKSLSELLERSSLKEVDKEIRKVSRAIKKYEKSDNMKDLRRYHGKLVELKEKIGCKVSKAAAPIKPSKPSLSKRVQNTLAELRRDKGKKELSEKPSLSSRTLIRTKNLFSRKTLEMTPENFINALKKGKSFKGRTVIVKGDLNLSGFKELKALPDGLKEVSGNLKLGGCVKLTKFPEDLKVGGHLNVFRCHDLKLIPKSLDVRGNLDIKECNKITMLSSNISVGGNLNLSKCSQLTSIQEGLNVKGNLSVSLCKTLTSIEKSLYVGGNLSLQGSKLTKLPEKLQVDGDLDLSFCENLSYYGEVPKIGGNLDIFGGKKMQFPEWIHTLGPRSDGKIRTIRMSYNMFENHLNTGIEGIKFNVWM